MNSAVVVTGGLAGITRISGTEATREMGRKSRSTS
jgi:hypothetical protein